MTFDYLVVGQGICGTWLSYFLSKAGADIRVIDDERPLAASRLAAGLINPVTGRRFVETWLSELLLPFAWDHYQALGAGLDITAISETRIVDFFPTPQMKIAFAKRLSENNTWIAAAADENEWRAYINYDFGFGSINPVYLVHLHDVLTHYAADLKRKNQLINEQYDPTMLKVSGGGYRYKDLAFKKIIYCDGASPTSQSAFAMLPFAFNKGEILWVQIPGLPNDQVFKKGLSLIPWKDDIFWLGSNYLWEYADESPSKQFYDSAEAWLKHTLKIPFTILDHKAGLRPATLERRPFVGFHPLHPNIGIFNGMGTKGSSLAPFFAKQLCDHIVLGSPIMPEADVLRFKNVLSR